MRTLAVTDYGDELVLVEGEWVTHAETGLRAFVDEAGLLSLHCELTSPEIDLSIRVMRQNETGEYSGLLHGFDEWCRMRGEEA